MAKHIFPDSTPYVHEPSTHSLVYPDTVTEFIHEIQGNDIIIALGPKNAGKSTLNRYMVNCLLSRFSKIQFLDLDPGQTEFTPPSVLSLSIVEEPILGPPFTNSIDSTDRLAYFGELSPGNCPAKYLSAVQGLITSIDSSIPVIVNYMGWIEARCVGRVS